LFAILLTIVFFVLVALTFFGRLGSPEIFIALPLIVVAFFTMRWAWKPSTIVDAAGNELPGGRLVGEARNVTVRQEFQANSLAEYTIWSFRVDRYDAAGNRLDPIAVELRGLGITGTIAEGDRVAVNGKPPRDKPLRVRMVYNLTTHSRVSANIPFWYRISKTIGFLLGLIVLFSLGFLSTTCSSVDGDPEWRRHSRRITSIICNEAICLPARSPWKARRRRRRRSDDDCGACTVSAERRLAGRKRGQA